MSKSDQGQGELEKEQINKGNTGQGWKKTFPKAWTAEKRAERMKQQDIAKPKELGDPLFGNAGESEIKIEEQIKQDEPQKTRQWTKAYPNEMLEKRAREAKQPQAEQKPVLSDIKGTVNETTIATPSDPQSNQPQPDQQPPPKAIKVSKVQADIPQHGVSFDKSGKMLINIGGPNHEVRNKKQLLKQTLETMGYEVNYNKGSRTMEIPNFTEQQQAVQNQAKLKNSQFNFNFNGPDYAVKEQKQLLQGVLESMGYNVAQSADNKLVLPDLGKQPIKHISKEVSIPINPINTSKVGEIKPETVNPTHQKTQPESRSSTQQNTAEPPKKAKNSTAKTMGRAAMVAVVVAAIGGFPVGLALAGLVLAAGAAKAGYDVYQKNKIKKENALRAPISPPTPVIEKKQELAPEHSKTQEIIKNRSPESQAFVKKMQESQQKNPVSKSNGPLPTPVNQQKVQQAQKASKKAHR